jgi:choline-glycine betaine transporter
VELTLNLIWAGLAAALLLLWRRFGFTDAQRTAIALVALVCVICILFPVISMTDDLNASPADPETVKLAVFAPSLAADGPWILVHDPHASPFRHEVETQPDYQPPVHSFLSFLLTRRPPPQLG